MDEKEQDFLEMCSKLYGFIEKGEDLTISANCPKVFRLQLAGMVMGMYMAKEENM